MSKDIDEMEKMLNDYLQFAKTQTQENTIKVNLGRLLKSIKDKFNNDKLNFKDNKELIELNARPTALQRSFENVIQNSLTYGKKVEIDIIKGNKRALITFEDDGPGIPVKEYNNVFRPFYKIDKGRSDSKNSVGLGMSISSDIIKSHGGKIELGKSTLGGLKIKIILPF